MGARRAAAEKDDWRVAALVLEEEKDVDVRKASMPGMRLRRRRRRRRTGKWTRGRRHADGRHVGGRRRSSMMVKEMGLGWTSRPGKGDRSWVEMSDVVASVVRVCLDWPQGAETQGSLLDPLTLL
jgi:hypothetical protein